MSFVLKALSVVLWLAVVVLAYLFVDGLTSSDTDIAERVAPPPPVVTRQADATAVLPTTSEWIDVQETPPLPTSVSTSPEPTAASAVETVTQEPSQAPEKTAVPTGDVVTQAAIPQSAPVQLYQPDTGLNLTVLELPDGFRNPVSPPTYMEAYWDPEPLPGMQGDFRPGTSTSDLSYIAAHTGFGPPDQGFNRLYDWTSATFTMAIDDEIWLKTEASGDDWLVYRLTNQLFVQKGELADTSEVWGAVPKPNHLILVGCRQIEPGQASQDNFVLDLVFDRVDRP